MKKILFVITVLLCTLVYSQQKKFNLTWTDSKTLSTGSYSLTLPIFLPEENYSINPKTGISFVAQWDVSSSINEDNVTLSNVKYASISKSELKDLDLKTIPSTLQYSLKNAIARENRYALLTVSSIIKTGTNAYKKITSFTVNYENSNVSYRTNNNQTITNSVLSSGTWYKFGIDKSGVFKLSKSFLNSLGINTDVIDPRTIKIYGNGGQMIPYLNNEDYPLDPVENAIKVVGEQDGVFNDGDYVMFYGVGPKGIVDNSIINTNINPYQDVTYYYLNVGFGFGKRIQNMIEPTANATVNISTFQDYKFHEVDEFNLAFVGRRWFGDKLDVETTKSFDFNFPNIVTEESVKFKFFGASTSGSSANWTISANNNVITTLTTPGINLNDDIYGVNVSYNGDVNVSSDNISITVDYDKLGVPSAVGYIDYISIEATRNLNFIGTQFEFYNRISAENTGVGMYTISNAANLSEVWDITDINNITTKLNSESTLNFKANLGSLKKYVAVTPFNLFEPLNLGVSTVFNQNIKGTIFKNAQGDFQDIDYVIVSPNSLISQASRLAQINREKNNLNVKVISLEAIYSEFNTGNTDIAAIRNLAKYVYDNASSADKRIKYLCLFGDSSFDYKGRVASNTYNTPSWHAYESFNLTGSYVSDDFYGMMDPNEGTMISSDKLDIAVGRFLADSPDRAKEMVDKVEVYYSTAALGNWRNNFLAISDDVDDVYEAELQETTDQIADDITAAKPFLNPVKVHTDAYQQEASSGGDRYPSVTTAIANAVENGALVVNYFGHGGEDGWAFERLFQKPDVQALRNECKLSCFVTVTCEYTRFDNPLRVTAGELVYWNKDGGAISLVSTTRQIYFSVGVNFNKKLEEYLFSYNDSDIYEDHEYPSIAEALRLTKVSNSIAGVGQKTLVFSFGDPALKLAFPKPNVRLTKINDVPIAGNNEVLEALSYAKLSGEVTDVAGNVLTNYNGKVVTTIYDKPITRETLGNDFTYDGPNLIIMEFETLGEVIFRGQSTVTNGEFEFDFIVPRDIGVPVGFGKVSFYASQEGSVNDQSGAAVNTLQIGGVNENAAEDNIGPNISLYMNDENFVSGGVTNESPTLLLKLQDENGINTASGIGHDIVAILDGDEVNPYVLNNYYVTELDDYTKGSLTYPFRDLEPGLHTLTLKAWDVYNNSSTAELQFRVFNEDESLIIENVLNYPNPFVNYTEFWFTHNSSETLDISVQIFTVSGKLVRTLNGQTNGDACLNCGKAANSTSRDIVWDGRDDFGDKIGKGTYVYKLKVHSSATNKTVERIEKLVIL
ncbi:peptidase C25-like protein [Lacinutrix venerupis]|uniref:type IX secretion system sortase PorU n=1 Tax=Lacinutrix venerupis TaxID=1486034 RepID=UPI000EB177AE|nr:type IX secretion system sortase PorU [Lacinutrix venerupis]RLJ67172.1 peptidase C25-like protein [Lacinutrix venerupis]